MGVLIEERTKGAERANNAPELDALARSDREADLEAWLEARGIEDAWEVAPTLVDVGFDESDLAVLGDQFEEKQLPQVLSYLSGDFTVQHLLAEIRSAATSISNIIEYVADSNDSGSSRALLIGDFQCQFLHFYFRFIHLIIGINNVK